MEKQAEERELKRKAAAAAAVIARVSEKISTAETLPLLPNPVSPWQAVMRQRGMRQQAVRRNTVHSKGGALR